MLVTTVSGLLMVASMVVQVTDTDHANVIFILIHQMTRVMILVMEKVGVKVMTFVMILAMIITVIMEAAPDQVMVVE